MIFHYGKKKDQKIVYAWLICSSSSCLIVFDVYGTLLDVYSISSKCDEFAPGKGLAISITWRMKQIEYTRLRSMHGEKKYKSLTERMKKQTNS